MISSKSKIGKNVEIGDYVVIEDTYFFDDMLKGVQQFIDENPLEYEHDKLREEKFGDTISKYGYWSKR